MRDSLFVHSYEIRNSLMLPQLHSLKAYNL